MEWKAQEDFTRHHESVKIPIQMKSAFHVSVGK